VDWGGSDVELLPQQAVAVSYGDLYFGVAVAMEGASGEPVRVGGLIAYGDDGELRLHIRLYGGPQLQPGDRPLDALVFVEARAPGPGDTLARFAHDLSAWELAQSPSEGDVSFGATHADGTSISYPYAADDPIGEALHLSPALRLCAGDLASLVNGDAPLPIA